MYKSTHDRPYWREFTLGHITENKYFEEVKRDYKVSEININDLKNSIDRNFQQNVELIDFLKSIKKNFILGVVSNHPREWFERCVKKFNWNDTFSIYAVSGYIHFRKPDSRIFQYAVAQAKVGPEECIYFDNRPDRTEGAKQLGIEVVIYLNNEQVMKYIKALNS